MANTTEGASLLARALDADPRVEEDPAADRILDAALEQFVRFGLRRSTVDDVAKRAGVSRVTVYRRFGNKDGLVSACLMRESRRFLDELDAAVGGLPRMEDRVVEGFVVSLRAMQSHPLMGGLLRLEPEVVLPFLTTEGGAVLVAMREYLVRHFRETSDVTADPGPVAELMVRVVVSFLLNPESCIEVTDDDQARTFARRYLAPLLRQ
ncbi:TetR/AcrR family transcriptional regulator [Phaeacidiphilus oryzae]|uniref:TetR/AcrR family transcriptional regulator n=1 Tax=Phaeacidiphilus oryzae TaxID=348818 RepID=UPI000567508C|nr:TetR/AcrR family transcriptional regulator [Phaeacidiphilus oryzae]